MLANPEVLETSFIGTRFPKETNRIPETEKLVLIPHNTTATVVVAVVVVVVAAAAAAAKKVMHNINPITQETFENSQSKAIQRFR
jgi:hypothetical protein